MNVLRLFSLVVPMFFFMACQSPQQEPRLVDNVDPFIGTGAHGHVFPGATTPFGMVQLSPNNGVSGWDWCSGYHISSNVIAGFTHMHLSGTGIGDLGDLLITPTTQTVVADTTAGGKNFLNPYKHQFSHEQEGAVPGYYWVNLDNGDIKAELTAGKRTGFHKYTFSKAGEAALIVDLAHAINWDKAVDTYIKQESPMLFTGYRKSQGWANDQWVYFAIEVNQPVTSFKAGNGGELNDAKEIKGTDTRAVLGFDIANQKPLLVKVGLSSASIKGAIKSIATDAPHWDFDQVKEEASNAWEQELQKIKISTTDQDQKTVFYTALYRSMIAPNMHSDANHEYKGLDGKVNKADGFDRYTVFSLWDTFRANHPLFTITQPERVRDFVHSFMAIYREGGLLPVWELVGNETNCMIGYHAIPVITDAWKKGLITDIPGDELLKAMVKSATQDKGGINHLNKYGFIPAELENESVSKALEYIYDDWCIAQMAKAVGNEAVYETFMERALFYKNHFDASTGFMRGKHANGKWKEDFDPLFSSHRDDEYTEGNAWQYSWFVPHDIAGLIQLHGSNDAFVTKLDSLFSIEEELKGENASPDISGLIGQYAHGNEPSHHVAYLYNYVGMPWKTAEKVREILNSMYTTATDGICGNEDCGQMSAWYVLSSLGFYPVNPAEANYVIGSPLFDEVDISLPMNKHFRIIAKNNSPENIYVQKVSLNGQALTKSWFSHADMIKGGTLEIEMGPQPNKTWGTKSEDVPPSMSR
ncbi:glycoside hydrolase family 92 protein [Marinilabiliaceae bacterium JC017]|nr:glycoside hydrolase family 92 protein [Marinilabiliaceae bacterium JC017]